MNYFAYSGGRAADPRRSQMRPLTGSGNPFSLQRSSALINVLRYHKGFIVASQIAATTDRGSGSSDRPVTRSKLELRAPNTEWQMNWIN